ncbi:hypothetical protein [Candidatus Halobonum tyrrellensis]|uniref:hypothetical protein n=1 Tax=Candidatus Halobonum tyrrellensis TaxID=1431545 RepID=UPI0012681973|nr:hypothetical protein [Candidatus Halobonum tyrrellensis]
MGQEGEVTEDSDQVGPPSIYLNNSGDVSYDYDVYVVDGPLAEREIVVERGNGLENYGRFNQGITLLELSESSRNINSFKPPANQSRLHGEYSLPPSNTTLTNITDFGDGDTVIVVVSNEYRVVAVVAVECSETLVGVDVIMLENGTDAGYDCR